MTVECEEFEFCKVKVNYTADSELVREKRVEVLGSAKKMNLKVPGFRQTSKNNKFKNSKAYETSLKKTYKKYLDEQLQKELVAEAYDEVLYETKMKPIGYPQINFANLGDETFDCEMIFLKKPDFELKQYTGFEIPNPHQEESPITRAELMIQELSKRHGEVVIYGENDFLQEGDQVTMDVKSLCDGNQVDYLTKDGMAYVVGQNTFKEFDHSIYGMKPGETRSFDIVFPDSKEINEEIRGKRVNFVVTLHMGTKLAPCKLDDTFAEKLGFKNFNELYNEALGTASVQLERNRKQLITNQILSRILDCHEFEVPAWMILMESQNAVRGLGVEWSAMTESDIENINKQSKNKIKLSMILDSIRDQEPEAVFSESEIINKIRANITEKGGDPDKILSSAQDDGSLIGLVAKLKDEATIEWLIDKNKVINENEVINAKTEETEGSTDTRIPE